ncbi:MAG: HNH endonuclease [Chlamydiae bacterium]|nr:HNH endonuclease [Chlamydiota bacterium]
MTDSTLEDFHLEVNCIYDEREYSVRDNGAVLRYPLTGKRSHSTNDKWTFGKPNSQNGYMYIGSVRIHRIVATAFHGEPPTSEHVVDHIDTNRRNNRPENLRWLTRLENALLNPITVKRIELICGSIEAFLEDPSKLRSGSLDRNFAWMRSVSIKEAQACLERMHLWAKSAKFPSGGGTLGEWVFKPSFTLELPSEMPLKEPDSVNAKRYFLPRKKLLEESSLTRMPNIEMSWNESDLVMAKTPSAAQRKWRTPTEFLCCPQETESGSIAAYAARLTVGAIFARNDFSTSVVLEAAMVGNGQSIFVMCEQAEENAIKPWSLAKITLEGGLYVHASMGKFFTKEGAEKAFCLASGLEWTGGDTFDDYC